MTPQQQQQRARLVRMGYLPVMTGSHTDGTVYVQVARKLGLGWLRLLITPAGDLRPEQRQDRQLTNGRHH